MTEIYRRILELYAKIRENNATEGDLQEYHLHLSKRPYDPNYSESVLELYYLQNICPVANGLRLNFEDIVLNLSISDYRQTTDKTWEDDWCYIDFSLVQEPWLNYQIKHYDAFCCGEIELLSDNFDSFLTGNFKHGKLLEFIEPDFNFLFYQHDPDNENTNPYVEMRIYFWSKTGALSCNYLTLTLMNDDVAAFNQYLKSIIGIVKKNKSKLGESL